jgi:hypothetical protein
MYSSAVWFRNASEYTKTRGPQIKDKTLQAHK